jgi:malate/lactate dehydrogenase
MALNSYGEKPRGRRPSRRGSAIERAKAYGVDVTLLDSALRRTPEERLQLLDENMQVMRRLRGAAR